MPQSITPKVTSANEQWLRQRGNGPDRELDELAFLVQVPLAARRLPAALPMTMVEVAFDRPRLRQSRSTSTQIGSYSADSDWLTSTFGLFRPLRWRIMLALVATGGALALHFPWWPAGLLGLVCLTMLLGRLLGLLSVGAALALLVLYPVGWAWIVLATYMAMMVTLARKPRAILDGGAIGPGLGFVPISDMWRLAARGAWSNLAFGLDKAQGDDVRRAEPFLAAAEPQAGPYGAVIRHARALVLARTGDATAALALVSETSDESALPRSVQGWMALVVSDILALAGQDETARKKLESALPLLAGNRARGIRVAAQLRLVDTAVRLGEYDAALTLLTEVRWLAVRRRLYSLMATTEGYLVQMMLGVGNREGGLWTLDKIGPRDARRLNATETSARSTVWSVLHAQTELDGGDLDEAERHAVMAVQRADLLADVGVRATANLALAEVWHASARTGDALPHVLTALDAFQQVRYGLPASNWRSNWVRLNTRAYELALEVAAAVDDALLVAEVIETIRSQAVPVGVDRSGAGLDAYLAALLDPNAVAAPMTQNAGSDASTRRASVALAVAGIDPLRPPPAICVGGASWVSWSARSVIDLDDLIARTTEKLGWYWSACLAAGRYWWVVRSPAGEWSWGSTELTDGTYGRAALDDLLIALPIRRPSESHPEFIARMERSPLLGTPEKAEPGGRLLERVSSTFLPAPLRRVLDEASPHSPVAVLVSLNGALAAMPINALPIDGATAMIDVARVGHIPAPALLAGSARSPELRASTPTGVTLAVVDPDPHRTLLEAATAPPGATTVLGRPTTKQQVQDALAIADQRGVFCALAHYVPPVMGQPASGGLAVADGVLSLRDLLPSVDSSLQSPRVPERVLLAMCESLSAGADDAVHSDDLVSPGSSAWEWLGLSAGFLLAGAQHVVATAWPLLDHPITTRFDHAIAEALTEADPAGAVRDAILSLAGAGTRSSIPTVVWAAYSYIGPLGRPPAVGATPASQSG